VRLRFIGGVSLQYSDFSVLNQWKSRRDTRSISVVLHKRHNTVDVQHERRGVAPSANKHVGYDCRRVDIVDGVNA